MPKTVQSIVSALALAVATFTTTASAHHSFAMFDRKIVAEISGTVKQLQWTNPHVYLDVKSEDDDLWTLEAGAPLQLESMGMKRSSLNLGDRVTVRMHPLKSGAPGGELMSVRTARGQEYNLAGAPPPAAVDKTP